MVAGVRGVTKPAALAAADVRVVLSVVARRLDVPAHPGIQYHQVGPGPHPPSLPSFCSNQCLV